MEDKKVLYSFMGDKFIKRANVIKYMMSYFNYSKRTAERRIKDSLEIEELFSDGKEYDMSIGLNPLGGR